MVELAANIWADGPSSNPYEPDKAQIRSWGAWVEGIITGIISNGGLIFTSLASLTASLNYDANRMAWVLGDATVANNGVYRKFGASGTGSWTRVSDLPFSFIIANDAGAGSPNAIIATTGIPVSGSALIWMKIADTNTASPVTVRFNGGSALTIKSNSGENVEVGGLTAGMILLGVVSGSTFRLFSDETIAAKLYAARDDAEAARDAAEVARGAAEDARDIAAGYASDAVSQGNVPIYATVVGLASLNIPPGINFIRVNGYYAAGDGGGAMYAKLGAAPTPVEAWHKQSADGAWWMLREQTPNDMMFGAVLDGTADNLTALQGLLDYAEQGPKKAALLPGLRVSSQIKIGNGVEFFGCSGAILKAKNSLNAELLINKDGTNGNVGIDIHHIEFDGNKANQAASIKDLIRLNKCSDSKVHHCTIHNGIWAHINVNAGTRVRVYQNYIYGGNGHGVVLRTGSANNRVFDNDIFDLGPANGVDNGAGATIFAYGVLLYDGACQDNWIVSNRINDPNGHGIYAGGFPGDEDYNYNKILHNVIVSPGMKNTAKTHNGIWITSGIGNEVLGNTVRSAGVDGVKLNTESHRNIVEGNYVSGCGRHGVVVDDANYNTVAGNHVFNNGQLSPGNGIYIGAFGAVQKHNDVRGNYCYDNQAVRTQSYGIREQSISNSSDYNKITDNRCYGNVQTNQMLTAGEHTKVRGNYLEDAAGNTLETFTATGTQTLPITARTVLINISVSTRTISLPVAANIPDDYEVLLVDIGANLSTFNAIINPSDGFTINGGASFTMNQNGQRIRVVKVPGEKRFLTFSG